MPAAPCPRSILPRAQDLVGIVGEDQRPCCRRQFEADRLLHGSKCILCVRFQRNAQVANPRSGRPGQAGHRGRRDRVHVLGWGAPAISASGTVLWSRDIGTNTAPVIDFEKTLYVPVGGLRGVAAIRDGATAQPSVYFIEPQPNPVAVGAGFRLIAAGVNAAVNPIAQVDFYLDDGDGQFDPAVDRLLGTATASVPDAPTAWPLDVAAGTLPVGENTVFAVATESVTGRKSNIVSRIVTQKSSPIGSCCCLIRPDCIGTQTAGEAQGVHAAAPRLHHSRAMRFARHVPIKSYVCDSRHRKTHCCGSLGRRKPSGRAI